MKYVDRFIKCFSWFTVGALVVLAVLHRCGIWQLPPHWTTVWLVPILSAGAVGYLTNWWAIWLLFRPYETLFGKSCLRGVVPKNQPRLAKALGQVIPERLLPQEEQTKMISGLINEFLQPEKLQWLRRALTAALD